jgi:hypothetical protein
MEGNTGLGFGPTSIEWKVTPGRIWWLFRLDGRNHQIGFRADIH